MKAVVVVASNRAAAGVYDDTTGPLLVSFLQGLGFEVDAPVVVPDGDPVGAMWLIKRVVADGWEVPRATEEATAIGLTSPALKKFALDYVAAHKR